MIFLLISMMQNVSIRSRDRACSPFSLKTYVCNLPRVSPAVISAYGSLLETQLTLECFACVERYFQILNV